ncbi:MFS transporter [Homoserinimonas sp. OAct 916]|uniref:MFS transporter n=1 Tax=Homoserinimonas sp. OAct 916 TaxID=2211450 RepID=UPI000DBE6FC6|nr:MFS transporter [Homoserinimonas sp. OAct 916]
MPESTAETRQPVSSPAVAAPRNAGSRPSPSLWRHPGFLKLWAGETTSQFGSQLTSLAIPVLAVSLLGASEFEVGLLGAAGTAAFLVIGLPAGAWVDRWLKRRVMIVADLVRMVTLMLIPALWALELLQMWHVYLVAAVIGSATVFFDVSYQSYVPILVAKKQVSEANSKLEGTAQVARIGGPAAAGGLLHVMLAPMLLFGTAIGYLVSAAFLWRIRDTERLADPAERDSLAREIGEGVGFVWRHPLLRRITATTAVTNLFGTITATLVPILVLRDLDLGAAGLGIMMSFGAVGGVTGALATPWLTRRIGEGTVIPLAVVASGLLAALVPLSAVFPAAALPLLMVAEFGLGFMVLVYNITQVSLRQRLCPTRLLGRMNASIRFVVWGVMPIAGVASGVLGQSLGLLPTMWIGVAGGVLGSAFVLFSPLMGMRVLPDGEEPVQDDLPPEDLQPEDLQWEKPE